MRKTILQNVHNLQRGITKLDTYKNLNNNKYLWISLISLLSAAVLFASFDPQKGSEVFGFYFIIGILILVSGITFGGYILSLSNTNRKSRGITKFDLVIKEIIRKRSRSLLLITLLGSALFIVFTVGINKKNVNENNRNNKSGTGGFVLFGETSIPVYKDLNDPGFRKTIDIAEYSTEELRFIQMKVKTGEDASCLNLNRVKNPHVIGINSKEFSKRGAFTFSSLSPYVDANNPWAVLDKQIL